MIVEKEIRRLETGRTVVILRVEGLIKLGESAEFFVSALEKLLGEDPIVDLAQVDYIDSTGIGEFIGSCVAAVRAAGHKLTLMNVSDRIVKLIKIAHAIEDFRVLTVDEAVEYAASPAKPQQTKQHTDNSPPTSTSAVTVRDTRYGRGSVAPANQMRAVPFHGDLQPTRHRTDYTLPTHASVVTVRDTRSGHGSVTHIKQMRVVTFHGDLQRIAFRYFPWRVARKVGLRGWVRDMPNGSVMACVEGEQNTIEEWLSDVRDGPFGYHVTRIEQELMDFTGKFDDFEVRS